ncbi:MAG: hypothetical protein K2Y20_14145 [Sphingomonas sp.]|nr:hypothetical protein [Sphingomonas sp.]
MTNRLRMLTLFALVPISAGALPMSAAAFSATPLDTWHLQPSAELPLIHDKPCDPLIVNELCVVGHRYRLKQLPDQAAEMVHDTPQALIERTANASRECRTRP